MDCHKYFDKRSLWTFRQEGDDLVAVVSNQGASMEAAPVSWESSDPRVIAVHGGMVEALTEGTATVTARSGLAEAAATLRVTPEPRRRALARHSDHPVAM